VKRWVLPATLAMVASSRLASAGTDQVGLVIDQCPEASVPSSRLRELAGAELAPRTLLPEDAVPGGDELWVRIRLCDGSPDQAVLIVEVNGHTVAERHVDLSDVVDDSRLRTLAVALAEIIASVTAAQTDVAAAPPSPAAGADAHPAQTDVAAAPPSPAARTVSGPRAPRRAAPPVESRRPVLVGAGIAVRGHRSPATWFVGPWLSVGSGRVQGELLVLTTRRELEAGTVRLSSAVAAAGLDLLSVGRTRWLALRARAEIGVAWASGSPAGASATGRVSFAPQGAGLLEAALQAPLTDAVLLEVRAASGVASGLVAEADGASVASTAGWFAGGALGVHYGFGR
jgi:hypothetical protein